VTLRGAKGAKGPRRDGAHTNTWRDYADGKEYEARKGLRWRRWVLGLREANTIKERGASSFFHSIMCI